MRILRVLGAALIAITATISPVSANHQVNNWTSSRHFNEYSCCWTQHWNADSFRIGVWMEWTAARAQQVRTNRGNNIFFTIDQNDISHNVTAYSYASSAPNVYFDTDDDNGDRRRDEAELVVENANWPAANTLYVTRIFWSRAFVGFNGQWIFDGNAGEIEFDENLSTTSCPVFCDKYDTHCCNLNLNINRSYPAKAAPAGAAVGAAEAQGVTDAQDAAAADVHLKADLSKGLEAYKTKKHKEARALVRGGGADGVVTFAQPVTWRDLARLEQATGVDFQLVEFVSEPDKQGLRWTVGIPHDDASLQIVEDTSRDEKVEFLGAVSATIRVPSAQAFDGLTGDDSVYLADLSIGQYKRDNPGVTDVSQNDVYWILAGWDR